MVIRINENFTPEKLDNFHSIAVYAVNDPSINSVSLTTPNDVIDGFAYFTHKNNKVWKVECSGYIDNFVEMGIVNKGNVVSQLNDILEKRRKGEFSRDGEKIIIEGFEYSNSTLKSHKVKKPRKSNIPRIDIRKMF